LNNYEEEGDLKERLQKMNKALTNHVEKKLMAEKPSKRK